MKYIPFYILGCLLRLAILFGLYYKKPNIPKVVNITTWAAINLSVPDSTILFTDDYYNTYYLNKNNDKYFLYHNNTKIDSADSPYSMMLKLDKLLE
jgi:hypothetical protein